MSAKHFAFTFLGDHHTLTTRHNQHAWMSTQANAETNFFFSSGTVAERPCSQNQYVEDHQERERFVAGIDQSTNSSESRRGHGWRRSSFIPIQSWRRLRAGRRLGISTRCDQGRQTAKEFVTYGMPDDWANYGEVIKAFKSSLGVTDGKHTDTDMSSLEEIARHV